MTGIASGSYVWGLDGSPGTIITDYVVGVLCSIYGLCILNLYKTSEPLSFGEKAKNGTEQCEVASGWYCVSAGKGAQRLLLILSLTFLICGAMNAIGALLHHYVPLVEPISDPFEIADSAFENLNFWSRMRLRLYPWYLVWQLANTSAMLYGIFTFLSAIYHIEFDAFLKDARLSLGVDSVDGTETTAETKRNTIFQSMKKFILWLISAMFFFHFTFRFWRIFEYRREIFNSVFQGEDEAQLNFHEAKMDLEKFGVIWSGTAASLAMISAFVLNAVMSTYLLLKRGPRANGSTVGDFKCRVVRTVGTWMLSFGGFIQLFYASSCGKNSATECPFHSAFNHNAWYHVLQGTGMTLWFLAEWTFFRKLMHKVIEGKNL